VNAIFNLGKWARVKGAIALLLVGSGLCSVFALPIWCYFISPALLVFFIVKYETSDYKKAIKAYATGDWKTFLEACQRTIEKTPQDANAHANAAFALANLHRYEESLQSIEKVRALGGDEKQCHLFSAMAHCGMHMYEETIVDCTKAIELNQEEPAPYLIRSIAFTAEYRYEEALRDIDHVLKLHPNLTVAKVYRAYTLHSMYKLEDARKEYEPIFGTLSHVELPFGLTVRAFGQARLGNVDQAIEDVKRAVETMPKKQEGYLDLAYFHVLKGDLEKAQQYLDMVESGDSFVESFRNSHRARILLSNKDDSKAQESVKLSVEHAERAVNLRPNSADSNAVYGIAISRSGQHAEGLNSLNRAIDIDPYCAEAFWWRGEVHEKLGEQEKAEADKKVAKDLGYLPYL
jgi:tetratricopeptide (TPR) repeat protein